MPPATFPAQSDWQLRGLATSTAVGMLAWDSAGRAQVNDRRFCRPTDYPGRAPRRPL